MTIMAQKRLTNTPSARVKAKPFTIVAPNEEPNQNRMTQVIRVAMFESRMDGQARFQARSTACKKVRPAAQLFLQTLKDQNIRVQRGAGAQQETGDTRQGQCDRDQLEQRQGDAGRRSRIERMATKPGRR